IGAKKQAVLGHRHLLFLSVAPLEPKKRRKELAARAGPLFKPESPVPTGKASLMQVVLEPERHFRFVGVRQTHGGVLLKVGGRARRQIVGHRGRETFREGSKRERLLTYPRLRASRPLRICDDLFPQTLSNVDSEAHRTVLLVKESLRAEVLDQVNISFHQKPVMGVRPSEHRVESWKRRTRVEGRRRGHTRSKGCADRAVLPHKLAAEQKGAQPVLAEHGWIYRERLDDGARLEEIGGVEADGDAGL